MTRDEAKQASYVHMCTVHLILLEVLKVAFTASSVPPMIRLVPVGARLIFAEEFLTPLSSAHTLQADPPAQRGYVYLFTCRQMY